MQWNRSEQKQQARTTGSIQHKQPTLASRSSLSHVMQYGVQTMRCGNCSNTLRRLDVECSSPNSQRSARCHLSEMDLTRQRLVTFVKCRVICLSDSEVCCQAQNPVAHFFRHFRHFFVTFVTSWFAPTSWSE